MEQVSSLSKKSLSLLLAASLVLSPVSHALDTVLVPVQTTGIRDELRATYGALIAGRQASGVLTPASQLRVLEASDKVMALIFRAISLGDGLALNDLVDVGPSSAMTPVSRAGPPLGPPRYGHEARDL